MSDPNSEIVNIEEIHYLLDHFSRNSYRVKADQKIDPVAEKCIGLFAKDYQISVINNSSGDLCGHYPSRIVIQEYEKNQGICDRVESLYDRHKLRDQFKQAGMARCRSRFVVPVILYQGKHICRSATLSSGAEMYSRSGLNFLFPGVEPKRPVNVNEHESDQSDLQMFDRVRGQDISVLRKFSIKYIVDLMVEKKKVKFGMNITSSEKVDKENRYGEFCIMSIPYPGCEFFKEWKDNSYLGEMMTYDWSQGFVDACLDIPPTEVLSQLPTDWSQYKRWNLIQLTQNYLKMLLHVLTTGDQGILIHCISGWDRTPMFVSILRLSLWADGAIHKSLSPVEMVYLTLAYDWYLFGHNLSDRLNKGEEIMLFCFCFLSNITSEEFSVHNKRCSKPQPIVPEGGTNHETKVRHTSGSMSGFQDRRNHSGSSSSLSSLGSFTIEPHNSVFYINSHEEDPVKLRNSPSGAQTFSSAQFSQNRSSSSPVQMPSSRGRQPSVSESPTCGSWQVISTTGSLLNTHKDSNRSSRYSSCEEMSEDVTVSDRWVKLDSVRRIFQNAYHNKITTKFKPDTGISNLFDQFAEKVGLKQTKAFN